jgi:hypothetical protein
MDDRQLTSGLRNALHHRGPSGDTFAPCRSATPGSQPANQETAGSQRSFRSSHPPSPGFAWRTHIICKLTGGGLGVTARTFSSPALRKVAERRRWRAISPSAAEFLAAQTSSSQLAEIAQLVDSGQIRPIVETVLPLSEARHAQEISQSGHARGKIVLKVA